MADQKSTEPKNENERELRESFVEICAQFYPRLQKEYDTMIEYWREHESAQGSTDDLSLSEEFVQELQASVKTVKACVNKEDNTYSTLHHLTANMVSNEIGIKTLLGLTEDMGLPFIPTWNEYMKGFTTILLVLSRRLHNIWERAREIDEVNFKEQIGFT